MGNPCGELSAATVSRKAFRSIPATLVKTSDRGLTPNVAGLLLLAGPDVLRRLLPTHSMFFQVLDALGNVVADETPFESAAPLLRALSEIELRFAARNQEREVAVGLIRLPIPDYAPESFREAVSNTLLHRDFSRMGAVYIQLHPDHLLMTNPGGFPEGITLQNILVHEPKPRNPRLAEAFKRIGLVEQTGRGWTGSSSDSFASAGPRRTMPVRIRVESELSFAEEKLPWNLRLSCSRRIGLAGRILSTTYWC